MHYPDLYIVRIDLMGLRPTATSITDEIGKEVEIPTALKRMLESRVASFSVHTGRASLRYEKTLEAGDCDVVKNSAIITVQYSRKHSKK